MNTSKLINYEFYGTNKRLADIERMSFSMDRQLGFKRNFSFSTENSQVILYEFGHIIIYTWPKEKLINVEILVCRPEFVVNSLKKLILAIFKPYKYEIKENTIITGFNYDI